MTYYIKYVQTSLIAGYLQRHLMERGAMHVRLEEIREFLAILLGAQQPRHEVHTDKDAVEGVTLEVPLEAIVAGRDTDRKASSNYCNAAGLPVILEQLLQLLLRKLIAIALQQQLQHLVHARMIASQELGKDLIAPCTRRIHVQKETEIDGNGAIAHLLEIDHLDVVHLALSVLMEQHVVAIEIAV